MNTCAIIGCGDVGASIGYTIIHGGLFSKLILIDLNHDKAVGEAMDMSHAVPFAKPVQVVAGSYKDLADCSVIVITAGANQKPDETRIDLVSRNTKIMESIIDQITAYNTDAILLVVSNPVDIMTYVALKRSNFPKERVIGSGTVLDTARLKYLLAQKLTIDSRNVHAFVIGEHGDSELPVFSSANISGIDFVDFWRAHDKTAQDMEDIFDDVRNSAYDIIKRKGSTYYGIAAAVERILQAIMRDENSVLTVSSLVEGSYQLHDLCIGLPSIIGRTGVKHIIEVPLNDYEAQQLHTSATTVKDVIGTIGYRK